MGHNGYASGFGRPRDCPGVCVGELDGDRMITPASCMLPQTFVAKAGNPTVASQIYAWGCDSANGRTCDGFGLYDVEYSVSEGSCSALPAGQAFSGFPENTAMAAMQFPGTSETILFVAMENRTADDAPCTDAAGDDSISVIVHNPSNGSAHQLAELEALANPGARGLGDVLHFRAETGKVPYARGRQRDAVVLHYIVRAPPGA